MKVRKLIKEEHACTRNLWERIFTEDTTEFLDYYYTVKTEYNEIFVVETEQEPIAMLHLNPYQIRVNEQIHNLNYIVAVATDEKYRKRGIMASLLKAAMKEMYRRKEPFTFLMPAAEAIYFPFGFRFIYRQGKRQVYGKNQNPGVLQLIRAEEQDCDEAAEFANRFLEQYQVVAHRDSAYYHTLRRELASEHGGMMLVRKIQQTVGMFCYAKGESYEIREPLFLETADLEQAVYELTESETEPAECIACGAEKQIPMIMARILHLETFLKCFSLQEDIDFCVKIQDEIIEENKGVFHLKGDSKQGIGCVEKIKESSEVCGEIEIGALTSILFGYSEVGVFDLSEALQENLKKIHVLSKVFLNEVV